MSFQIFADSCANMPVEYAKKHNIKLLSIPYITNGEVFYAPEDKNEKEIKDFYVKLKGKAKITTSCLNEQDFITAFTPVLEEGKDILYFCFSSALSRTFECSQSAIKNLQEQFPDRKILSIDTVCECMGITILIDECLKLNNGNASIEEMAEFVKDFKDKIVHIFTVDDLGHLYRSGRVTAATYAIGSMFKIKPVLRLDEQGKLTNYDKVLGRKKAVINLAETFAKKVENAENQTIYIAHADCEEDALLLKEQILKRVSVKDFCIDYLEPVISALGGPGSLALFFIGNNRAVKWYIG